MPYTLKHLTATEGSAANNDKRLSICLSADGFSFAETTADGLLLTLGQTEGRGATTLTAMAGEIKAVLAEAGIRPLGYQRMELVAMSNQSTWVPDELYNVASNRHYLGLVGSKALSAATCHSDTLKSTAVYVFDEQALMAFKVALPGLVVMHQHTRIASLAPSSTDHPLLFCHWREGFIDVAAMRGGQYLMGNSIAIGSEADVRFRIVEVAKACGVDGENAELLLCGEVDRSRYALLSPYFAKATLYSGNVVIRPNSAFRTIPTYKYAITLI